MAHDDDKEYASKGVAGSGLGLGIAGTALALLNNNGGLANLLGGGPAPFAGGYRGGYAGGPAGIAGFDTHYIIENERRIGCMEAELTGLKVGQVKDARIALLEDQLAQSQMFRYVDDKTCGVVKGQNLLNPNQIADPYMGQRMVIATHPPVVEFERFRNDCGCNNGRNGFRDFDRFY